MKQPSLLTLPQFPLSKKDFEPELFHKIIYVAINKLVHNGIQEITEIEIENVVKTKPAFWKYCKIIIILILLLM